MNTVVQKSRVLSKQGRRIWGKLSFRNSYSFKQLLLMFVKEQKKNSTQHAVIGIIISTLLLLVLL